MSEQVKRSTIQAAARLRRDVGRFEDRWPVISASAFPPLSFTWEQLERQLSSLATTPVKQRMASDLVSGTRKQAWAKPSEMVLQEILLIAAILADDGFNPSQEEDSDPMT
ncbi:hypothetical protein Q0812_11735 [Brevundimonas sp. 2R-24]|uniref:Uncharacterized protein n=1 Tax=Peiella sedimenti TaxID=3061083 RepID=A0ABT8SNI3_9CAUL|nr:hypothetical protein [Caulobacteraceae bacterium XZ-24]